MRGRQIKLSILTLATAASIVIAVFFPDVGKLYFRPENVIYYTIYITHIIAIVGVIWLFAIIRSTGLKKYRQA